MAKKKQELARRIYNQKTIDKVARDIDLLGTNCKYNPIYFMNMRLFLSFLVFILVFVLYDLGYILGPVFGLLFYYFYYYFLIKTKIKRRAKKLESEAMTFFEVLTLSLETGRNLEQTLLITCNNVDSELSSEFKRAISEVRFGKSLSEILVNIKKYIPSESINNMILGITQSNIMGNSIIETLKNQIDYLREKKILEVKAEISKIPTKISIISVLFFIPLILFIIIGPVIIDHIGDILNYVKS